MDHNHHNHDVERQTRVGRWVLIGFLAIAAFFLWTEHRAHLLGVLPFLLILACPLMHFFLHGGHGHHGGGASTRSDNSEEVQRQMGEKQ